MRLKPILFNTEMVRAILDGRKTVTRRIANINTEITCNDNTYNHEFEQYNFAPDPDEPTGFVCRKCGFGVAPPHSRVPCGTSLFRPCYWPGDILYVRETWGRTADLPGISEEATVYAADFSDKELAHLKDRHFRWRPSIHMPKDVTRLFLKVKSVRAERLRDMVLADVLMEGITEEDSYEETWDKWHNLWDSTIPKADLDTYGWKANPWVWVIQFEVCEKPEGT